MRNHFIFQLTLCFVVVLGGSAGFGRETVRTPALAAEIDGAIRGHDGGVSLAIKHLETGETYGVRAGEAMPTASLIKIAIMATAYEHAEKRGLDLGQVVTIRDDDKVPGSGVLTKFVSAGVSLSLRDLIGLMIGHSDNTATNVILDRVGVEGVNAFLDAEGLTGTRLHAKVFRPETTVNAEWSKEYGLGRSRADETIRLLEKIHRGELVSKAASAAMWEHLTTCEDRSKLARELPEGVKIGHKSGEVARARCGAGIMITRGGPIAVCVFTKENKDQRYRDDNEGTLVCARVGKVVYEYFNEPAVSGRTTVGPIKMGSRGVLVSDLQRTLNARLTPSPELTVDGEFGPKTAEGVKRFQEKEGLAITAEGEVTKEMWERLGPLAGETGVPEVAEVNGAMLPVREGDRLNGQPVVTCKAWAIGDAKTGEFLWGSKADAPLDFASTTKLMTAYVVFQMAKKNPEIMDEIVLISEEADDTPGSTADVRGGERVPVKELLYGLMLPSGNDAARAFAEHFGGRMLSGGMGEPVVSGELRGARFVEEMNRTAAELGMRKTRYMNPHGLTHGEHKSTARDLLKLGVAALKIPELRKVVSTRQHACRVESELGYSRNAVWKNTNRLLRMEGYSGLKTGTTDAAGACLISVGKHQGDELVVVVLGSSSNEGRYADTRNLFRWGWRELGHVDDAETE